MNYPDSDEILFAVTMIILFGGAYLLSILLSIVLL